MNKVMCLCAAATLAFASCSNDETVEIAKQNAISFRSVVGLNTKGAETTTANLNAINVTAYKGTDSYFTGIKYEKGNSNFFESTNKYYWPADDSELTFTAFSDNWSVTPTFTSSSEIKATDVTVEDEVADQKDMVYVTGAKGKKSTNESNGLGLTLGHALSQIQINAKNGNSLYKYKVRGIRIAKVGSKSTFDVINGTWGNASDVKTYDVVYADAKDLQTDPLDIMGTDGNAMLIPQTATAWDAIATGDAVTGSYISVLLQITTSADANVYPKNGGYGWAAVPVDFNWEKGKKYTYTLDFTNGAGKVDPVDPNENGKDDVKPGTDDPDKGKDILGSPIKFTVEVSGWDPAESGVDMSK